MAARVTPLNEPLNTSPTERTVAFQTDEDIRKEEEEASAKNAEQKAETVSFVSNKSNVPSDKFVLAFMTFVLVVSVTAIVLTCTVLVMMKQKDANCLRRTGTNNTTGNKFAASAVLFY